MEKSMEKVYEIYIRTTPERLWEALVDPEVRSKYTFGAVSTGEVRAGAPYEMSNPAWGGIAVGDGETLEVDPSRRLVQMREGADEHLYGGWPMTLSTLKTWLETGTILTTRAMSPRLTKKEQ